jgi:hypothetical protein
MCLVEDVRPNSKSSPSRCWKIRYSRRNDTAEIMPGRWRSSINAGQRQVQGSGTPQVKVPLGKLATERMVPLDEEAVALIDRICAHRSPGRPLPHPRTARTTEFLLTHHGRRVTVYQLRGVLTRDRPRACRWPGCAGTAAQDWSTPDPAPSPPSSGGCPAHCAASR